MNKYLIISIVIVTVFLSFFLFKSKHNNSHQEIVVKEIESKKWNTFGDHVNGWKIKYPPEVTDIHVADDMGPRTDILGNYLFSLDGTNWIFGIASEKTEYNDIETFIENHPSDFVIESYTTVGGVRAVISTWPDEKGRKNVSFIKRNIWFSIYINSGQDYQKIIEGFKFLY